MDIIAQNVAAHGEQERMTAAFQPLEQIGPAEADETLAGPGKVVHHFGFALRWRKIKRRFEVVCESVTRQVQNTDGVHHPVRIEPRVLIVRVVVTNPKCKGFRLAFGEMKTTPAFKDEKSAVLPGLRAFALGTLFLGGREHRGASRAFGEGVVPFDKGARAPNHEETH
jgi:hypothetical protein